MTKAYAPTNGRFVVKQALEDVLDSLADGNDRGSMLDAIAQAKAYLTDYASRIGRMDPAVLEQVMVDMRAARDATVKLHGTAWLYSANMTLSRIENAGTFEEVVAIRDHCANVADLADGMGQRGWAQMFNLAYCTLCHVCAE